MPNILPPPTPAVAASPSSRSPLSWEKSHPDRLSWSTALFSEIDKHWDSLSKASDASFFCAKYPLLGVADQKRVWAEIIVWDAYFESDWDPKNYSVDVGAADDNSTWSVGLLQVSVIDQESYGLKFGLKFSDLQTPDGNLELAMAIMAHQIDKHGKILIPVGESGIYWSTLHPGGKYDKSAEIANHVTAAVCQ